MRSSVAERAPERERRARSADRLTERILANLAPLSVELATTAAEVDVVLRMRCECAVEMGWVQPEQFPSGRERDEHDERATLIVCLDGEAVVGTIRVIPPDAEGVLPIERQFGIRVDPPGDAVEAGRLVIAPSHRGGDGHPVLAALFSGCWIEARKLGYDRLISLIPTRLIELYRTLGLRIEVLGPARMHWGQERTPVEIGGGKDTFDLVAGAARS